MKKKEEKINAEIEEMKRKGRRDDWLARMERERLDLERERFRRDIGTPEREREERYIG